MRAGQLRHRITIQTDGATTQNAYGEVEPVWSDTDTVWGSVEPLTGTELFRAQQVQPDVTCRVRMRYRALSPDQRLTFTDRQDATRTLDIVAALEPKFRGAELEVLCREAAT